MIFITDCWIRKTRFGRSWRTSVFWQKRQKWRPQRNARSLRKYSIIMYLKIGLRHIWTEKYSIFVRDLDIKWHLLFFFIKNLREQKLTQCNKAHTLLMFMKLFNSHITYDIDLYIIIFYYLYWCSNVLLKCLNVCQYVMSTTITFYSIKTEFHMVTIHQH